MHYKISYTNPSKQYIPIEAEFDTSNLNQLIVQFPAWRPGRYELGNFAKNSRAFTAYNENKQQVNCKKITKDSWEIACKDTDKIVVSYQYYAAELNAGSTFMDDIQLYVNPVNCLIYTQESINEPCTLKLTIPPNFKLACGAQHQNNIISCKNYHELVDSPFIASATLQHKSYEVLGKTFTIWFQGEVKIDWNRLLNDFEKFTLAQLEKFSSKSKKHIGFPTDNYHFLFQILPLKAYHGVEHTTSTVIALGPSAELMEKLYDELLGVSSHELYHVWNIKSIRPVEMFPYDYSKENYSKLGYVAEGVTTYLGDVFLALSGVKDFNWYKSELEKLLQKHFTNFGRFNYSVAESSWDTWLDGYVAGAPNRKVSIYTEGALLAFAMDIKIRVGSNNKASLHDVMKDLYTDFALQDRGYTENDYKERCEFYAKQDLSEFFEHYINGVYPYESIIVEALNNIGFTLEMDKNPNLDERILGVKTTLLTQKKQYKVTQIWPGSPAELGGVIIGDLIKSINGYEVDKNINEVMEKVADQSLTLTVERLGREVNLIGPNTNRDHFPIYSIKKMLTTANASKRIFKNWIGTQWETI